MPPRSAATLSSGADRDAAQAVHGRAEYVNLRANPVSAGTGVLRGGKLIWRFESSPNPLSRTYGIRLELDWKRSPEVYVERPDLHLLAEGKRLPHVYQQEPPRLCLFPSGYVRVPAVDAAGSDPSFPGRPSGSSISKIGSATDEWKGGGMHPGSPSEREVRRRRRRNGRHTERGSGALTEGQVRKILALDGGGIRGVFPAAFLAKLEEQIGAPIASYFDLIAGTSTGGISPSGSAWEIPASDILKLYEERGPASSTRATARCGIGSSSAFSPLAILSPRSIARSLCGARLTGILGDRRLGESRARLVIPAWHPRLERVYVYKRAHHPRLETDWKTAALDCAMATAAAPTFLKPHLTDDSIELVDGGV